MHSALTTLIDRLDRPEMFGTDVIHWGAPVPSFGDLSRAGVATLGLNPSNREFVDDRGDELQGFHRRFHTLNSLGLRSWADADSRHLHLIMDSCRTYFLGNPYDRWFKRLDQIIADTEVSYYSTSAPACHLDLIPYATVRKWTDLTLQQRLLLLKMAGDTLALLLRDSPVRVLILNGESVVSHFQQITGISLRRCEMNEWTLHRDNTPNVLGFGYEGFIDSLCGVRLSDRVLVLGYNHNIQSSFGISTNTVTAIRRWVAQRVSKVLK
ncbi:MAG: hypothetical protein WBL97_00035 [Candidatus Sulfotelmatobacter sp.]